MFSQSQSYYYDDAGKSNSRDVWQFPVANCPEAHFAVFPRALVQKCLSLSTRAGDWVLDPFAGMGTVIDVALANGNRAIGIELSHDYCERATKNIRHGKELFA
jgi:DNA modification methylase